ncbi:MAG: hypothetical protein R3B06_09110 [Kofleriaceae bacterium]
MTRPTHLPARLAAIVVPAAAAAGGLAAPWSVLWGGLAWLVFLVAAFAGWGYLVERAVRTSVDVGLRVAWGIAAFLTVGGFGLALGRLDRTALAGLLSLGGASYAWRELTVATPTLHRLRDGARASARRPAETALFAALAALALLNIAAAVVHGNANVYDDDVAYTPLVRRLLDIGNLDEPFSFRRISAFGGQTILSAAAAVRGTFANLYLPDEGLGQLVTLALVVGLVRRRDTDRLVGALVVLMLLLLPPGSINTASYWTGAALFLALYRTVADGAGADDRTFAVAGLVAAATCSLRQNYLPVAVAFVLFTLVLRLDRPRWAALVRQRRAWLAAILVGALAMVPYLIASWRSNHTFLYPFQLGTFNPNIQMTPTVWSTWQELQFFLKVALEPDPIRTLVPLVPVMFLVTDRRPGRPLTALALASAVGFGLLVHTFTLSDAKNLWRYAFGFATALTVLVVVEGAARGLAPDGAGTDAEARAGVRAPLVARYWLLACVLAQLASTGKSTARRYRVFGDELAMANRTHARADTDLALPAAYQRLQGAAPPRATIAVLLDQPVYLDYARNRILNLDVPGYASWRPGWPFFQGAEPVAAYFRAAHVRYLAFVRGDYSRYFFRRQFWVRRLMTDTEIWQIMGAYVVDALDNFTQLADHYPRLYDRDGMVMLDLGAG